MDALDRRWLWVIYGSLVVPYVGPWLLIVGSSVLYYVWRRKTLKRAAQLNKHAWIAWSIGIVLSLAVYLFVPRR